MMSAFNIPDWRAHQALAPVELPPELPVDLLELPTIDPTAPKLRLSKRTVWEKCRNGSLGHLRISGRCIRIRQSDLDSFIRKCARK